MVVSQTETRLDRFRERMDKAGFASLVLTSPAARSYVLGADLPVGDGAAVLTSTGRAVGCLSIVEALRVADDAGGVVGIEADRPAGDIVFSELAASMPAEVEAYAAAADLADIGYTAVMDHLYVGMSIRGLAANVDRSTRRAGGLTGWYDVHGSAIGVAGTDLVTVRGHDASTACLTAESPVRYVLHPLLDGVAGYAATTALLSKAEDDLRAVAEVGSSATAALVNALRPGALLRDGYEAFAKQTAGLSAASKIVGLRGNAAALAHDSGAIGEAGMVLGVRTAVAGSRSIVVEFAATVALGNGGAELLTRTPLRLVELY